MCSGHDILLETIHTVIAFSYPFRPHCLACREKTFIKAGFKPARAKPNKFQIRVLKHLDILTVVLLVQLYLCQVKKKKKNFRKNSVNVD